MPSSGSKGRAGGPSWTPGYLTRVPQGAAGPHLGWQPQMSTAGRGDRCGAGLPAQPEGPAAQPAHSGPLERGLKLPELPILQEKAEPTCLRDLPRFSMWTTNV